MSRFLPPELHRILLYAIVLTAFVVPLNAQSFSPIPPLHFVKAFAGADPLPQLLTVTTSAPANFVFRSSAATSSGGSWLTVTTCGVYCDFPRVLTVTVAPAVSLAPGTYLGQVLLTEVGGTQGRTLTIPVTLTIAPAGSAFLDNLPGQLSFTMKPGAPSPPSQTLHIRNAGAGALNWNLASSTSSGAAWLNISASSGAAPSYVTVSVNKQNLPNGGTLPGTYIGHLTITAGTGSTTIPISVVVSNDVFNQVNPLSFVKPFAGPDPLPQTITIATNGSLQYAIRSASFTANGGNWLSVTNCGVYCLTPAALRVTVAADVSLAPGTYTAQVVLTDTNADHSMTVPVSLTVAPAGTAFFDNIPGQLSYSFVPPAISAPVLPPPMQSVEIHNGGAGTLAWTITAMTSDGGAWLVPSSTAGTAPSRVSFAVNPDNLPSGGRLAGSYTGLVVLESATGRVSIPVNVVVGPTSFKQTNGIHFTKPFGGANPLMQALTISANTTAGFAFRTAEFTGKGGDWLTVTNCGVYCLAPQVVTASVNANANLPAGTYTGEIIVFTPDNTQAATIPVTLTIVEAAATPLLDNLPGQISFTLKTGTTANPAPQPLQIRNGGAGALQWEASSTTTNSGNWLTVSAPNGTAPATLMVGVNVAALPGGGLVAGTYNGEVVVRAINGLGSATVPVSVVIGDTVFSQLTGLTFTKQLGVQNPLPQTFTVTSTGGALNFRLAESTATGGDWLTATNCGVYCTAPRAITATVNAPAQMTAGTYTGQILLTEAGGNMAMTVPVTLVVTAGVNAPTATAVSPATGTGASQTFTATYTDLNGGADIASAFLMVASAVNPAGTCFVHYDRASNSVRLMNDAGSTWSAWLAAGTGSTSNSQCTVNSQGLTATVNGNTLTVTYPISFLSGAAGQRSVFALAIDAGGISSQWAQLGTWNASSQALQFPPLVSFSPLSGSGLSGTFTAVYRQPGGKSQHYLGYMLFLPSPNIVWFTALGTCLIEYNRISNGMRLIDNAGTGWIGPPEGVPVHPATPPLSNNMCTVNVAGATISFAGNDMTVTIPVVFKATGLTPVLGTFLQEQDVNGVWTDMRQFGNWVIPGAATRPGPGTVSLSPTQFTGNSVTLTATASHTSGVGQIGMFHLLIADKVVGGSACQVVYFAFDDTMALINDAGTDFAGAGRVARGTATTLANSRCSVNAATTTRVVSGNNVTVSYPMTFAPATFGGLKNVYMNTFDLSGNLSHWVQGATVNVQ